MSEISRRSLFKRIDLAAGVVVAAPFIPKPLPAKVNFWLSSRQRLLRTTNLTRQGYGW